jgi:hypothetical protein
MRLRTTRKPEIHHAIFTNSKRVETYGLTASYGPRHSWCLSRISARRDKVTVAACLMENSRADETARNPTGEDSRA